MIINRCRQRARIYLTNRIKTKIHDAKDPDSIHYDIANLLRIDSVRSVHMTKTGHPSSCASLAQIFSVLFFHQAGLKFHANNTAHFLNDRLVLSKGHAAPILYSALYRAKVITQAQLMSLRQKGSIFEGHPTPKVPFVDVATGSLGQGLSVSAGMAYSSKYFDKISNRIHCVVGDGEMAEGNIWEAIDFAQNYKLNNLTLFVDMNRLGQSQQTMYGHNPEILVRRFQSFGWSAEAIDGHSIPQISQAIQNAQAQTYKPYAIICKTVKGKNLGSNIQNKEDWHGKDLGEYFTGCISNLKSIIKNSDVQFTTFAPVGERPLKDLKVSITPNYKVDQKISTRKAYGIALRKARQSNQNVVALDGDTKNSTFAITLQQKFPDSFIECFIAEQNMVGVAVGLSCRNKIPFCSSFAAFLMRAADQVRIAGIGGNPIKIVGSHSGCSIGEDGPSQMALQDLGFFRNMPKGIVLTPSDGVSLEKAVELVANYKDGPSYVRTSRPDVPILYKNDEHFELGKCNLKISIGKVLRSSAQDKLVLISHGVIVHQCMKVYKSLLVENIKVRVIDLFSLKPVDEQGIQKCIVQCGGNVIVAEEHYQTGGAYEAVCGVAASHIKKIKHLCVRKVPGSAKPQQQLQIQGIDAASIEKAVRLALA